MDKPFAITLDVGSSRANHTGAWRTERPVYVHNLPPCNSACPAGENIQQWLYDAEEGPAQYEAAWRQIMQDNPFPAVMGRAGCRPCETACNRAPLAAAVGMTAAGRFLPDDQVERACRDAGHAWRERLPGPVATFHLFLVQVLSFNTAMHDPPAVPRRHRRRPRRLLPGPQAAAAGGPPGAAPQ